MVDIDIQVVSLEVGKLHEFVVIDVVRVQNLPDIRAEESGSIGPVNNDRLACSPGVENIQQNEWKFQYKSVR